MYLGRDGGLREDGGGGGIGFGVAEPKGETVEAARLRVPQGEARRRSVPCRQVAASAAAHRRRAATAGEDGVLLERHPLHCLGDRGFLGGRRSRLRMGRGRRERGRRRSGQGVVMAVTAAPLPLPRSFHGHMLAVATECRLVSAELDSESGEGKMVKNPWVGR